ncbi:MAG: hypothetical protein H7233_01900 [Pseudorhodobacter sp.]|nr:hypothetical protein [Frankiaceae bacterium]
MIDRKPDHRASTGVRARLRRTPGGTQLLQSLVFVLGLLCILLGIALAALPGPLTIPPILLGLYIWSTEFAWADRLLDRAKASGREAWAKAKAKPVLSAVVTLAGLAALAVGVYLVGKFDLLAKGQDLVGL